MLSQFAIGSLALSTCVGLPPGDIKSPQYWGDYMLDKYAAEKAAAMVNIEPGPAPLAQPRTVLLITGVTIPGEWFDPIVVRLERDGFKPVVYEPPDLLSGDLYENAELLAEVVAQVRAESGEDKIDILAECTGGLLARHYIQALGGDQYISRLVTFISPQNGLPKAKLAFDIAGWPALEDLTPGSQFLEEVKNTPLPPNVPVTSVYTCTDEFIQPFETSVIPGARNINICDGEFVGHYQFFYDPKLYLVMHGALVEPIASTDPTDPTDPNASEDDPGAEIDSGGCAAGGSLGAGSLVVLGAILTRIRRRRPAR